MNFIHFKKRKLKGHQHAWSMSCAAQCMALHWIYNFDEIRDINKCYIYVFLFLKTPSSSRATSCHIRNLFYDVYEIDIARVSIEIYFLIKR